MVVSCTICFLIGFDTISISLITGHERSHNSSSLQRPLRILPSFSEDADENDEEDEEDDGQDGADDPDHRRLLRVRPELGVTAGVTAVRTRP